MKEKGLVLVTGGMGFIGSHLSRRLVGIGYPVRVMDNLDSQVHSGAQREPPCGVEFVQGDVRDPSAWERALEDVRVVFHEAAAVGIGQSMYQISRYVHVNTLGTANLLDHLANKEHDVDKLIVASSNTVYGEGAYECERCGVVYPGLRSEDLLRKGVWEPLCPVCGLGAVSAVPTNEEKPLRPTSIYATTKRDQEEMSLQIGRAYGISTTVLRYFCVYGPGQSLTNPYTGVAAIFHSRVRAGQPPVVYEDGEQTRDFVNVRDVVQANVLAMRKRAMGGDCFNVGTGVPTSVMRVAQAVIEICAADMEPYVPGQYRSGDIRHCYADIAKIERHGYRPSVGFREGMKEFLEWAMTQKSADRFNQASEELASRGLVSRGRKVA